MSTSIGRPRAAAAACLRRTVRGAHAVAGLAGAALLAALATPARAADAPPATAPQGEWRLLFTDRRANTAGPLAEANARQPGLVEPPGDLWRSELELRHTLHAKAAGLPLSLAANLLGWSEHASAASTRGGLRANELALSADLGAWQLTAGRKVLGWDVGQGFRPNDVVQQEARRTLFSATPEGRPLLQVERYGSDDAWSLVWVQPERWNEPVETTRGPRESAFALRGYRRFGAVDAHAFARRGRHTGSSLGAAAAWVAGDALELHGSVRWLQRHDGWSLATTAGNAPQTQNPWQAQTLGRTTQWLVGGSWTGESQQSLLVEYWHDGSTLSDADWDRWAGRNAALRAFAGPAGAAAGNLAWQATPFDATSLRQDNLFVRLAWQPGPWQLSADLLLTPADRGRLATLSAQWQGDRWRFNAAWRVAGGPAEALLAQIPVRRSLLLAASWAF